jgi:CO/xanthine dehydrogenase Mo-binding subunit
LRSPHAYATIEAINVPAASSMPGVHVNITTSDFPKLARYPFEFDYPPPADGVVRHIGEGAAAVATQTPEQALDSMAAINLSLFGSRLVSECDTTASRAGVSYRRRSPKPHAASDAL